LSIFTKFCPQCSDSVEASAARCRCGYIFDTTTDGSVCAGDLLEQNERMYLEYLEARVIQAEQEFKVARSAADRDPENRLAAAELLRAEQAMNNARAELSSQSVRLETTRALVTRNRPTSPPKPAVAAPTPKPVETKRSVAPVREIEKPKPAAVESPRRESSSVRKVKNPTLATAPTRPLPGLKLAVPHKAPAAPTKPARATFRAPKTASPAIKANNSFRAAQAAKADRALKAAHETLQAAATLRKIAPAQPRTADPLATAKAAMQVRHAPPPNTRECPNCTARLALEIGRCRCGYEFPTAGAEIPSLSLRDTDLASLSEHLSLSPLDRGR